MHHHVVADALAFGVQALEDAQRSVVAVLQRGALAVAAVAQVEGGVPGHAATSPPQNKRPTAMAVESGVSDSLPFLLLHRGRV